MENQAAFCSSQNLFMKFEKLSVSENIKLVGGFSQAFSQMNIPMNSDLTNNCNGGNCEKGCHKRKKHTLKAPGDNLNCKGNCVLGCGKKY